MDQNPKKLSAAYYKGWKSVDFNIEKQMFISPSDKKNQVFDDIYNC